MCCSNGASLMEYSLKSTEATRKFLGIKSTSVVIVASNYCTVLMELHMESTSLCFVCPNISHTLDEIAIITSIAHVRVFD